MIFPFRVVRPSPLEDTHVFLSQVGWCISPNNLFHCCPESHTPLIRQAKCSSKTFMNMIRESGGRGRDVAYKLSNDFLLQLSGKLSESDHFLEGNTR
jgi:hypothetical protein